MSRIISHYFGLGLLGLAIIACHGQSQVAQSPEIIKNFKAVALAPDFDTTLVSQYIRAIFQDSNGHLWFGTIDEGVLRYDQKTLTYFAHPEGLFSESVFAINEDQEGNIWIGTDQGVYQYDGKTFKNYKEKDGLKSIEVSRKSILVDRQGSVWVGTHDGIFRYDRAADAKGLPSFVEFEELKHCNVAGMLEDRDGNIWIASSHQGVYRFDGKDIWHLNDKALLGENYAGGIAQDKAGNLWFTMKNGICMFDGKEFTEITPEDGLGGTEFWGLYIEDSGIIWITARGSTTRFDPSLGKSNPKAFQVFTPENGLNCCVQSMFQDQSGNMWWGAGQGLYRFNGIDFYQVKKAGPWN